MDLATTFLPPLVICGSLLTAVPVRSAELVDDNAADHAGATEMEGQSRPASNVIGAPGMVLVDGEHLPPPYHVTASGDTVLVNGRVVRTLLGRNVGEVTRENDDPDSLSELRRRSERVAGRIALDLRLGAILVAFRGRPPVLLRYPPEKHGLLEALMNRDMHAESSGDLIDALPDDCERKFWRQWLAAYVPSDDLRGRVEFELGRIRKIESANVARITAIYRLQTVAYPLSVIGMVLVVAALGHLLSSHPGSNRGGGLDRPEALRANIISISLIAVFSLVDLVWTVLAIQAGQMRELNPLGRTLIPDPRLLVAFKVGTTVIGCGILYRLRRHTLARMATWWLCLLCTVLLLRWAIFHSMFIA